MGLRGMIASTIDSHRQITGVKLCRLWLILCATISSLSSTGDGEAGAFATPPVPIAGRMTR